jgi:hypothetical protein
MALQHLRSSTANKRPTPAAMSDGQLAMNTNLASPGLFLKDSNGDLVKVGPVHVGTTAPNATPAAGGQAGNSVGEQWLDTSSSRYVFKIWDGTAWRTEDGEFVNSSGDTMTGALVMDNQQQVRFRETTANGTNFIALQAPTSVASDKTITLPDVTGTVVTTGDTGSVTSTMILDGTILNADVNASAAIAGTKISPNFGSQTIATTGVFSHALGAAATPSITFTGDLNTGIYSPGADQVAISTNGVERVEFGTSEVVFNDGGANYDFRIEGDTNSSLFFVDASAEAVGIGTTSPGENLSVSSTAAAAVVLGINGPSGQVSRLQFKRADTNRFKIECDTSDNLLFYSDASTAERARIDSSGRLLVGTSSVTTAGVAADISLETVDPRFNIIRKANNAAGPALGFGKTRSTGSPGTVVQSGDKVGTLIFYADDGTDLNTPAARIDCEVDGTPGTDDMPGRLVFSTTADGASSPTERMRITSGGELLVGGTNDNGAFNIQCNGTGVWGFGAYVNGSDERLKENIHPLPASLDVVKALNPVAFQYKPEFTADTSVQPGFIAQELQAALADQDYLEGVVQTGPEYLSVAYQSLIPVLTKALQEAIGRIETLEAEVTALKAQ